MNPSAILITVIYSNGNRKSVFVYNLLLLFCNKSSLSEFAFLFIMCPCLQYWKKLLSYYTNIPNIDV